MPSSYPSSLDSFSNPTSSNKLNDSGVLHADQHANANDAIEAIEATLGINPQGASATVVARLGTLATNASPTFTGTVTLPLTTAGYVKTTSAGIISSSSAVAQADVTNLTTDLAAKAPIASPTLTGTPAAPTAAANTNTTQIATTAFVLGQGNTTAGTIAALGAQSAGTSNLYARADHIHPTTGLATSGANSNITSLSGLTTPLSAAQGGTGLSVLGTGVATFLGTPTSANLASALTDETGSSKVVFSTNPAFAGIIYKNQPTPTAQNTSVSLTIAQLLTQIITTTSTTAVTLTLPTGTLMDGGVPATLINDDSFDWSVINLGSGAGAVTMAPAASGHTYVGNTTIAISTSARFRSRKTATATWVTYRIS